MDTIGALSCLALIWPILCSAQESLYTVADLLLPTEIFSGIEGPYPTAFSGNVSMGYSNSQVITAYTINCDDIVYCQSIAFLSSQWYFFTATTSSTTFDLLTDGTVVCGATNTGPNYSGTATCTQTAGRGECYDPSCSTVAPRTESDSFPVYFLTMDEELSFSLDAYTTSAYLPNPSAAPTAAASSAANSFSAPATAAGYSSSSAAASTSTTSSSSASSTLTSSSSKSTVSPAQQSQTTSGSPIGSGLTEDEKIGIGVGIVAFVLVCCAAGVAIRLYRKKRRAANPNPSELYFTTDEKGQAAGT